ncbi:unnamed protein product [Somion occarium]|uniref:Amine oxidase domain-containing protein n=2 Tax=Somion occarium TaxID=3059160 RepID=A0ABP1E7I5_9APHY
MLTEASATIDMTASAEQRPKFDVYGRISPYAPLNIDCDLKSELSWLPRFLSALISPHYCTPWTRLSNCIVNMSEPTGPSIRTRYASRILRDFVTHKYNQIHGNVPETFPPSAHPTTTSLDLPYWKIPDFGQELWGGKVCIIGAGVAGLYLAMQLEKAGIMFDVVEASDRIGGRVNTYTFTEGGGIPHNYYDIGAMRFPKIAIMNPVFNLFSELGLDVQPYYLSHPSAPNLFDNAAVSSSDIDGIMKPLDDAIRPFITALQQDWDQGFKVLMQADGYTTRQWLTHQEGMTFEQITRLETYSTATGLFDQAFAETVLDSFDFNEAKEWSRVEGGTSNLTAAMERSLKTRVQLKKRVIAIAVAKNRLTVEVTVSDEALPRQYDAVFNTTTMGCLGQMDLSRLPLNEGQQMAIRALSYDKACKVAIKFSNAWWSRFGLPAGAGGSSATDLPIRVTVYPSWDDGEDDPAVAICSYTWAQDATRMGSHVPDGGGKNEILLELVLRNLARLFQNKITYHELTGLVEDYHAFSYSHDPDTLGAFALFGAGQFTNLYPAIREPAANGRFFFVGECASEHHAWIVGSIQSAREALKEFGIRFDATKLLALVKRDSKHFRAVEPEESEETVLYHLVQFAVDEKLTIGEPA